MKLRAVAIVADYLAHRPKGRVVRVLKTARTTTSWGSKIRAMDGPTSYMNRRISRCGWSRSGEVAVCSRPPRSAMFATGSTQTEASTGETPASLRLLPSRAHQGLRRPRRAER